MSKAKEILSNISNMSERSDQDMIKDLVKVFGKGAEKEIKGSFNHKGRYGTFGESGSFKADGEEYNWIESEDEAERIALEIVKNDLESEPEIFNQDWLQEFISISDTDIRMIASEDADSRIEGMSDEDILGEAGMQDEYDEEENDDKKEEILDQARETAHEKISDEIESELEDPIQFFVHDQGTYTVQDLMKQNFISIDTDAAADSAISADGWAHFLSLNDGNYDTTSGGVVYFRE